MGNFISTNDTQQESFSNPQVGQATIYDYTQTQRYQRNLDDYRRQIDDLVRENKALKRA